MTRQKPRIDLRTTDPEIKALMRQDERMGNRPRRPRRAAYRNASGDTNSHERKLSIPRSAETKYLGRK